MGGRGKNGIKKKENREEESKEKKDKKELKRKWENLNMWSLP